MAIVVLGGGEKLDGREYHELVDLGAGTLERLRYAALLAKTSRLPVLVTAGSCCSSIPAESQIMKQTLIRDFDVPLVWEENKGRTTHENAVQSLQILKAQNIKVIYLVTHANHMPRAMLAFTHAAINSSIKIIPAPMGFYGKGNIGMLGFIPDVDSFYVSSLLIKEYEGLIFYWVRYRLKSPVI